MKSSENLAIWKPGNPTWNAPTDTAFLQRMIDTGHTPLTGPAGLFGASSKARAVYFVYRGHTLQPPRKPRWEIWFVEGHEEVASAFIVDFGAAESTAIAWLDGEPVAAVIEALSKLRVPPRLS